MTSLEHVIFKTIFVHTTNNCQLCHCECSIANFFINGNFASGFCKPYSKALVSTKGVENASI